MEHLSRSYSAIPPNVDGKALFVHISVEERRSPAKGANVRNEILSIAARRAQNACAHRETMAQTVLTIALIAFGMAQSAQARSHHHASKPTAPVTTPAANVPEKDRDPADLAIDRRIKGICKGC